MDWLTKIWNSLQTQFGIGASTSVSSGAPAKKPILKRAKNTPKSNEITMSKDISDAEITRSNYVTIVKNPNHKVKSGDNLSKIADKYGVSVAALVTANGLSEKTVLKLGQTLVIPPSRKTKNVKNLNDTAKAMGVSLNFIKSLKATEDGTNFSANKFHNTLYTDNAGVQTIGIGHAIQNDAERQAVIKKYGGLKLTNAQVCELFANDLLKAEENITAVVGKNNYEKMPQAMKEALLDMVFNKGNSIIKNTEGLLYCLKNGKYEAAVNKFTDIKSTKTGKEMSGLAKRRLFDVSVAINMYNGKIPQSNINTAQNLYNKGVVLLRQECKAKNLNFTQQIAGYNKDIQGYFGNKVKLNYVTK